MNTVTRAIELLETVGETEQEYFNAHAVQVMRDLLAEVYQLRGALTLIGYGSSSSWEYYQYIARESLKI